MITSILFNATPEEVRFIMVDPKMLELSIYEGIPHLLLPVVTDPKKANLALRWAVDEMERRYELLAKTGVRDIASYNQASTPPSKSRCAEEAGRGRESTRRSEVVIAGADGDRAGGRGRRRRRRPSRRATRRHRARCCDEDLRRAGRGAGRAARSRRRAAAQAALHRHRHRRVRRPHDGRAQGRRDLAWRASRRRRAPPAST